MCFASLRSSAPERLVHQQHRRLVDQRARDGDALLLAAGELRGITVAEAVQIDPREHLADALADSGAFIERMRSG